MGDQIISFKTAELTKEKGFNTPTEWYYYPEAFHIDGNARLIADGLVDRDKTFYDGNFDIECGLFIINRNFVDGFYNAPTQASLQRLLREVHNIRVLIDFETIDDSTTAYTYKIVRDIPEGKGRKKDTWDFYETTYSFTQGGGWYKTYEEALELGLIEGLKLIK